MKTVSLISYVNPVSIFPNSIFTLTIESASTGNTSINFSSLICQYYKKYYTKITFPTLQEAHMRYVTVIRNLREDADKTQKEIADILGTSQTMYARYERGANELPIHHLLTLCDYYGITADYLLGRTDKSN